MVMFWHVLLIWQAIKFSYTPVARLRSSHQQPTAYQDAIKANIAILSVKTPLAKNIGLLVDALIGVGLKGSVRPVLQSVMTLINNQSLPVASLDIPTGIHADTGCVMGMAVHADISLSFVANKLGFYHMDGPEYCGKIIHCDLKLPEALFEAEKPAVKLFDHVQLLKQLMPRPKNAHKNNFGRVLMIGSGLGYARGHCLGGTSSFAHRCWISGYCDATCPCGQHCNTGTRSIGHRYVKNIRSFAPFKKASVCLIGPGLGTDQWAKELYEQVLRAKYPWY